MFNFITTVRALGDENRARILMALRLRTLCVCEITTLLGLAASTTSKHLFLLRQARLIESIKKGRWVYYQLPQNPSASIRTALAWTINELAESPQIAQDEAALRGITHDAGIHDFLKNKHIRVPADEIEGSDDTETAPGANANNSAN